MKQKHGGLVHCHFCFLLNPLSIIFNCKNCLTLSEEFTVTIFCFTKTLRTKNCIFSLQPSLRLIHFPCRSFCSSFKPAPTPVGLACPVKGTFGTRRAKCRGTAPGTVQVGTDTSVVSPAGDGTLCILTPPELKPEARLRGGSGPYTGGTGRCTARRRGAVPGTRRLLSSPAPAEHRSPLQKDREAGQAVRRGRAGHGDGHPAPQRCAGGSGPAAPRYPGSRPGGGPCPAPIEMA